jgi:cytochrome c556
LAGAAKAGDDAAVTAKVKALGDVCSSCHKAFRAEKYSE